ncbi:MAG: hypothetical protein GF335_03775 [Candidatus Moranbacteria bacterium]|nr:hypothetical protein [Candidatus Moranbacteria bacterium]
MSKHRKKYEFKFLIIFLVLLFFAGFYLFYFEEKHADKSYNKEWVAFYFQQPNKENCDFVIENYLGKAVEFDYKIQGDDGFLIKKSVTLEPEDKKNIQIQSQVKNCKIILNYLEDQKTLKK